MTIRDDRSPDYWRAAMRAWRKRSDAVAHQRDWLVLSCLAAGILKEEVHQAMGLGRTTIDRIEKREGTDA